MSLPYGGFTTMLNPKQILAFAPRPDVRKSEHGATPQKRHFPISSATPTELFRTKNYRSRIAAPSPAATGGWGRGRPQLGTRGNRLKRHAAHKTSRMARIKDCS